MKGKPGLPPSATMGKTRSSFIAEGGSPGFPYSNSEFPSRTPPVPLHSPPMAVYHFTLHAYRSWSPNHRRGYTRRGEGYQLPDPEVARQYDARANHPKVVFDRSIQEVLIVGSFDICRRRGWRLHAVGTDPSHVHMVISWHGFQSWRQVMEKLKNVLSYFLGRATEKPGRRWFVTDGSRKRVMDQDHLDYLMTEYLPDHPGLFWCEGEALPEDRHGFLQSRGIPGLPPTAIMRNVETP
jgi:REP element-mobilizing transposase RayT